LIYENPRVSSGLTADSIGWALTSPSIGWYPITWMSHMLDVDLWQMRAGMHLMTNVALHIISVCLLFLALQRMTRCSRFSSTPSRLKSAFASSSRWR
jgi:hypothetical protein